jgi:hypothetical protein
MAATWSFLLISTTRTSVQRDPPPWRYPAVIITQIRPSGGVIQVLIFWKNKLIACNASNEAYLQLYRTTHQKEASAAGAGQSIYRTGLADWASPACFEK